MRKVRFPLYAVFAVILIILGGFRQDWLIGIFGAIVMVWHFLERIADSLEDESRAAYER